MEIILNKILLILTFALFGTQVFAMPYRCISDEVFRGKPLVNLKVSLNAPKHFRIAGNNEFVVGVTPASGNRFGVGATGNVSSKGVMVTFVEDHFVTGYLDARPSEEDDMLIGDFKHSKVSVEVIEVKCVEEIVRNISIVSSSLTVEMGDFEIIIED